MLSRDRFLSCPSFDLGARAGRMGLVWLPGRDAEERLGDMLVSPVRGEGWVVESRDSDVGAVDGETARTLSTLRPAVSHIEGAWAELPVKYD